MIFRRAFAVTRRIDTDLTGLVSEGSGFLQGCARTIASLGKTATLFGDGATALPVIERGLQQVDRLLRGFRVAPGIGKAIQKVLDQTLDVVRRMIPALRLVLARVSRVVSVLNISAVPAARDAFTANVLPLFQPVRTINDSLLLVLPLLERQQYWIELFAPKAYLAQIEQAVARVETLDRLLASRVAELKQINAGLVTFRAFLDSIYGSLSIKKAAIDNIKAFLEELGESIKGLIQGIGDVLPGWLLSAIEAVVDFIDSAIDWVLRRLGDLLDWIGIDFRSMLRWIEDAKNRVARELAELLSFVDAVTALIAPLETWAQYLQSTVTAVIGDAAKVLRDLQTQGLRLLQLLQGLRVIKVLLEFFLPRALRGLRLAMLGVQRDAAAGLPRLRRELVRIDTIWASEPIALLNVPVLGEWLVVLERIRVFAHRAPRLKSASALRKQASELLVEVRRIEALWQRSVGKQVERLPAGYLEQLAELPIIVAPPTSMILGTTSDATDRIRTERIRNVRPRIPTTRIRPTRETIELRDALRISSRPFPHKRLSSAQRQVEQQLLCLRDRVLIPR